MQKLLTPSICIFNCSPVGQPGESNNLSRLKSLNVCSDINLLTVVAVAFGDDDSSSLFQAEYLIEHYNCKMIENAYLRTKGEGWSTTN